MIVKKNILRNFQKLPDLISEFSKVARKKINKQRYTYAQHIHIAFVYTTTYETLIIKISIYGGIQKHENMRDKFNKYVKTTEITQHVFKSFKI